MRVCDDMFAELKPGSPAVVLDKTGSVVSRGILESVNAKRQWGNTLSVDVRLDNGAEFRLNNNRPCNYMLMSPEKYEHYIHANAAQMLSEMSYRLANYNASLMTVPEIETLIAHVMPILNQMRDISAEKRPRPGQSVESMLSSWGCKPCFSLEDTLQYAKHDLVECERNYVNFINNSFGHLKKDEALS